MKSSASPWLVIGYGNALRGDDSFGLEVLRLLATSNVSHLVETIGAHQLVPELAEPISRADYVIFVDASVDLSPGKLQVSVLQDPNDGRLEDFSSLSHSCVPQSLLADAKALYGHAPNAWLYAVGGGTFDLGEDLSPILEAMVPKVVRLIAEHIESSTVHLDRLRRKDDCLTKHAKSGLQSGNKLGKHPKG
jgi:hydrogenase maturation protease